MEADEFQILTSKVISKEASPEELEKLKMELYRNEKRREEFDSLLATSGLVKELQHLVSAMKASRVELPAYRMGELQGAVRSAFPQKRRHEKRSFLESMFSPDFSLIGGFAAVVIFCGFFFFSGLNPHIVCIGVYDGFSTRGDQTPLNISGLEKSKLVRFKETRDYDVWTQSPLRPNERAKIAISRGEVVQIQVWQRKGAEIVSQKFELSGNDPAAVQKKLDEIYQGLRD